MEIKIYSKQGIYNLDDELGNFGFYNLMSYSTPAKVKNLFAKNPVIDSSGIVRFDFDGYELNIDSRTSCCRTFFKGLETILSYSYPPKLITLDNGNSYTYVISTAVPEKLGGEIDDVRIIIFEKNNTEDSLEGTVIVKDFVLRENVCQEEIEKQLLFAKEKLNIDVLKKTNSVDNDYRKWSGKRIVSAKDLEDYFNSIKDKIIGKTLEQMYIRGILFGYCLWDEDFEFKNGQWFDYDGKPTNERPFYYPWKVENSGLQLDEPLVLCFGDIQLEIKYNMGSVVHVAENTLDAEKDCSRNVSNFFSKNLIGHKLVDIKINKVDKVCFVDFLKIGFKDGDDMFDEIWLVFDNGYKLEIVSDGCDYMYVQEVKNDDRKTS